ncbi:protein screw-like [Condylostylus longicornis]|uniref:protein screw-like n=1 Tax=Condylostylus longicornis TaxID=2530218 RepID=UPI00244E1CAA|nr:protein screw-like [Condylostylus longicornis]
MAERKVDGSKITTEYTVTVNNLGKKPEINSPEQHLHRSSIKFLYTLYEILKDHDYDHNRIRQRRSVNSNFITDFDLIEVEKCNNIITFAPIKPNEYLYKLRIFKNLSSEVYNNDIEQISILVYLLGNIEEKRILLTSINISVNYIGWLEIDISVALRKLIKNHGLNPALQIVVHLKNDSKMLIDPEKIGLITTDNNNEEFHPFIIGLFNGPEIIDNFKNLVQENVTKRLKRNIVTKNVRQQSDSNKDRKKNTKIRDQRQVKSGNHYHNTKQHYSSQMTKDKRRELHKSTIQQFNSPKYCQRMNFTVDFYELNWENWIIAPEKFDAYFCSGECNFPLGAGMNATNHALIQTLMRLKNPWLPKPCCAPRDLGSISVLYYLNEQNVNLRKYKHMVAYNCGCH